MATELKTVSTKIIETDLGLQIEMTLATSPEIETAQDDFVQVRVLLDTHEIAAPFVGLQIIALEHVQTAISLEIRRLKQRGSSSL